MKILIGRVEESRMRFAAEDGYGILITVSS